MTLAWDKIKTECESSPVIGVAFDRLNYNFSRVNNLLSLYKETSKKQRGRVLVHQADILRSAVVLMHAMLEDCLRTIASHYLPLSQEDYLSKIPLHGLNNSGRPEKFHLSELAKFKGMTVDQVISASVNSHLDRTSFNNVADITNLLQSLDVDTKELADFFPTLESMISRRHQIVHRGDRVEKPGKGKQYAESIRLAVVEKWAHNAHEFLARVFFSLIGEDQGVSIRFT
ncbi:HEPN domain-containing protein [Pseudomonas sp. CAU 1711]|uniref:HEPN domain-containing protein n=1 Tax=Pseudomonas sp. CAU 1711 TaxID=3140356 RepID=UPI0032603F52